MSRATAIFLIFCTTFAFFLRWWLMPTHLFFGPEQGRDFLAIRGIVYEKNFTLIGPKTDFSGVFHGPLYYYIASVPFVFSKGNPLVVVAMFILLQALTVFLAYGAGKEASGKKQIGLTCALLFAVSYGSIVYSRWLTQVPLALPFSFFFIWQLFRFLKGKHLALIWVALAAGLLGQVQFIYFLFVPAFLLYIVIRFRKNVSKTPRSILLLSLVIYVLVGFGTFITFDLRHQFLITKSMFAVFSSGQQRIFSLEPFIVFIHWVGAFIGVPI